MFGLILPGEGTRIRSLLVGVHPTLAQSGTLSQFHPLELTAAALTVPSAGIRWPDPGTTVSLAQDADLPAGHRVAHWGGGSGPARVGWGAHRAWRAQGLLERAQRATAAVEPAADLAVARAGPGYYGLPSAPLPWPPPWLSRQAGMLMHMLSLCVIKMCLH